MSAYRVLARKYRPTRMSELVGQEVLARTLSNAIAANRLAHAWLFTGIRGIGKTTTARILARALNCTGPDGQGGPTPEPCGVCSNCTMIGEDRHMDVLEMDAASRTGVSDIRDIIETVQYLPSSARTKVYIIDEVHMLSQSAFNALLKTLEEPPPHVKFIFATTEIRKIPVTILSRCQRFDLKRLETEALAVHLKNIADKEAITAEEEALTLIAAAAEGSVRDGLSLLDQAIAHSMGAEEGAPVHVTAACVRDMLGLADKTQSFTLLEPLLEGNIAAGLAALNALYRKGADPVLILQDALEAVHFLTKIKLAPAEAENPAFPQAVRERAKTLAATLTTAHLTRAWQMLLKGLQETRYAPDPLAAAEMIIIRLAHAAELPSPAALVEQWQQQKQGVSASATASINVGANPSTNPNPSYSTHGNAALAMQPMHFAEPPPEPYRAALSLVEPQAQVLGSFEALVQRCIDEREPMLSSYLKNNVSLVHFAEGVLSLAPRAALPEDFAAKLNAALRRWTGRTWQVTLARTQVADAGPTMAEQHHREREERIAHAARDPLVAAVLEQFPGAVVENVTS